ncbi:MAG: hypothetical protein J0I47_00555 [Sphingomonas sp.]|uniref:hypothetical protein n=1 Tax=Sphingomonas sp. TaxID=28214 RepID=UPI001ACE2F39|nr:hypothetical protein [Sphingomonas sp.]MBN8806719.1 hypothetical protein [Sphingomonas sp.]
MLILLAIGAAVVIAGMIYGNYLARQRHKAIDAAEERAEEAGVEPTPAPTSGDVAPAPEVAKEADPADRAVEGARPASEPRPAPSAKAAPARSLRDENEPTPDASESEPAHPHPSAAASLPPSPDGRGKGPAAEGGGKGEDEATEIDSASKPVAEDNAAQPEPTPIAAVGSEPATPPAPAPISEAITPPAAPAPEAPLTGALALTTIKGLGPKVAALLAERGVTRVDQLAALSDADAAALDAQLGTFAGRMTRDRWLDQANLLASGDTAAYEAEFGKLG